MDEFLWNCFEVVVNAAECFATLIFLDRYFTPTFTGVKHHLVFWGFWLLLFGQITVVNLFISASDGWMILIPIALCLLYTLLFTKGKLPMRAVMPLFCFFILFIINKLVGSLMVMLSGQTYYELVKVPGIERAIVLIITKLVYAFILSLLYRTSRKNLLKLSVTEWIVAAVIPLMSIISSVFISKISIEFHAVGINQLYIIGLVLGNIIIVILVNFLFMKLTREHEIDAEYVRLSDQQERYQQEMKSFEDREQAISKVRHDQNNFNTVLLSMLEENRVEEAKAYILQNTKELQTGRAYAATPYKAVNSLINAKLSRMAQQDADIKCIASFEIADLDEMDLGILLGNLLDNIINYYDGHPNMANKAVSLIIENRKDYLVINLKNTVEQSVLKDNPNLQTTKQDTRGHGLGIKRVKELTARYDGSISFTEQGNYFCCNVLLKTNANSSS